jgi:hypothetical protein
MHNSLLGMRDSIQNTRDSIASVVWVPPRVVSALIYAVCELIYAVAIAVYDVSTSFFAVALSLHAVLTTIQGVEPKFLAAVPISYVVLRSMFGVERLLPTGERQVEGPSGLVRCFRIAAAFAFYLQRAPMLPTVPGSAQPSACSK